MKNNSNEGKKAEDDLFRKYEPKTFGDILGMSDLIREIKASVEARNMPNLFFYGGAGRGKTTLARVIARETFKEQDYRKIDPLLYREFDSRSERGLDWAKKVLLNYCSYMFPGQFPYRIIYLDEADRITPEAYAVIRDLTDPSKPYYQYNRFIATANVREFTNNEAMNKALRSRFRRAFFELSLDDVTAFTVRLCRAELDSDTNGPVIIRDEDRIARDADGDLREVIRYVEKVKTLGHDPELAHEVEMDTLRRQEVAHDKPSTATQESVPRDESHKDVMEVDGETYKVKLKPTVVKARRLYRRSDFDKVLFAGVKIHDELKEPFIPTHIIHRTSDLNRDIVLKQLGQLVDSNLFENIPGTESFKVKDYERCLRILKEDGLIL